MRQVEPKVFLISRPSVNDMEVEKWLAHLGITKTQYAPWQPDGEKLVMLAGKRCYNSFEVGLNPNITRVREEACEYIDNILRVRHGSVIAHCHYTFAIEGVTRVGTAELNRHRVGVCRTSEDDMDGVDVDLPDGPDISEGSLRFIRFEDIPWYMPQPFREGDQSLYPKEMILTEYNLIEDKKERTRAVFERAFQQMEDNYKDLLNIWKEELSPENKSFFQKKTMTSAFRRLIGMGVATGGTWTFSLRALRNVFTQRCAEDAEEEILKISVQMLDLMKMTEPLFFDDFKKNARGFYTPQHFKV